MKFRHLILATMITAGVTSPARAETCHLTVRGTLILDDEPCSVRARAGTLTASLSTGGRLLVRRTTLLTNLQSNGNRRHSRLKSYGRVTKSDANDGKVCYFNQTAVLCIERDTGIL